jgi:SAM-dependent methyltransferase
MPIIPWRIKNLLSENFPLLYHIAVNLGTRGNSTEHWDRLLAQGWDASGRHWPTKNKLIASLTESAEAILDVGCGTGSILRYLKSCGYTNLHGLEISDYAIKRLRGEGIKMHFGVLPEIALPDDTYDVVIASQVLEHVIRRRRFVSEIRRVLKPGGRAFIFVPDDCLGPIDEPEHVVKFNTRSLQKLLEKYFSVVAINSMHDENFDMPVLFAHLEKHDS